MATPAAVGLTVADIEALPEDMVIRHLIDGELFEVTPPTIRHQKVVTELLWRFRSYAEHHGGMVLTAPTGVRLSDRDMPEPDVLYVAAEHLDRVGERYVEGPPDLVVEVSSPSTRRLDLVRKRRQYERFGVPEFGSSIWTPTGSRSTCWSIAGTDHRSSSRSAGRCVRRRSTVLRFECSTSSRAEHRACPVPLLRRRTGCGAGCRSMALPAARGRGVRSAPWSARSSS